MRPHARRGTIHTRLCTLIIACFLITTGRAQPEPSPVPPRIIPPDPSTLEFGIVSRVIDENSLLIEIEGNTRRYDLLGLSAVSNRDKPNSRAAIDAISRLALGERVALQHDPESERAASNRRSCYLYRLPDYLPINLELIRNGYARYNPTSVSLYADVFAYYEGHARSLERGIWSTDPVGTLEPETEPEPAHDEPQTTPPAGIEPDRVYVTAHGTRYHRENCPHLTDSARPTTREQVRETHKPCRTCKPDD